MIKLTRGVLLSAALMLALVACGTNEARVDSEVPAGSNAGSPSDAAAAESSEAIEGDDAASSSPGEQDGADSPTPPAEAPPPRFGEAVTWDDGLSVRVEPPVEFTPSEYVDFTGTAMRFTVIIVNHTGTNFDPSGFSATLQSGNREAEQIYDSGAGIGRPDTKLLDGREVEFDIAFGVSDPSDLVLEVSPDWDFDRASAIFVS